MGIDVYLNWKRMKKADREAQHTGWRVDAGNVGYLREAYHGGPYATRVLLPEGWQDAACEDDDGMFAIPAQTLRERLPAAVLTALYREEVIYKQGSNPGVVIADDGDGDVVSLVRTLITSISDGSEERGMAAHFNDEQIRAANELIDSRNLPDVALAFVDFVSLAEQKEARTGEPCRVYVSA